MDPNFLDDLVRLMERTSTSEIEHSDGQARIRLVKGASVPREHVPNSAYEGSFAQAPDDEPATSPDVNHHAITAGLVGTFYRSPAPDQAAFVSLGDLVVEGQTIAIVEAMKLLNSIEADLPGRIAEIAVEDGATVSADSVLFIIETVEVQDV
ncbi:MULTISPECIES: acetyl-CoA carboxylase biotin carboxyl carrier protein [Paraburkholderia]|uniref:acetyl-CoA carboxylase biotin carboxyl carrier protein n=1 Tax=Paraburkholderia TaxID=1822464 RepID=UPI0006B5A4E8|nr:MULTISPECIES: biotin/lipoyl-containing protein [Paraburkholderia]KPD15756.1 hypothetical protein ADM96_30575 [Burkholderia sp. ST111]MBK5153489.1 biotin/lipoyl-binding protein [Burkholderia sp. R-69608]MBK5185576.1 biotin/lipoyl-binding protein [Burkholderia sp. R-69749]CAE6881200.1 Biotin carboxyl carrier protein of acetyl-CoA carboxylase [Paraburkholderia domus]CAE6972309.1 Biotin carboxyl carrier protein of acetyl-CoA carboxylase [Paraburkholderia nemoris]